MFAAKASTLSNLQMAVMFTTLVGLWYVDFTFINIALAIVAFYFYSIIGISITLHRYYTHKSFEFSSKIVRWFFTGLSVMSLRGSPIGWTYVHRLHHTFADTEKDPHSPYNLGLKLFFLKDVEAHSSKMNKFIVKDMINQEQLFINKYYFLLVIIGIVLLALISPSALYFLWVLPVTVVHVSQAAFNYFAHTHGYRSNESKDKSTNNIFLWPFIMGDAWHNNHHSNAASISTKEKYWEIDPAAFLIKVVQK